MDKMAVTGGRVLNGVVSASGAKNAALPILFSTLLAEGRHVLRNVPQLKDIESSCALLESLGGQCQREGHTLIIDIERAENFEAHYDVVRKMRASILCLGPLVAKYGHAKVSLPGGCAIGSRPINFHIESLKVLGADIEIKQGYVLARCKKLLGDRILFDSPSVGATENIVMAACLAEGRTIIENAAKEPEIVDLVRYLKKMGAQITGEGTSIVVVDGVERMKPAEHQIIPDRIEAGTLLIAGAITGGHVTVNQCCPKDMKALLNQMRESGFKIFIEADSVTVGECSHWRGVDITTAPSPAFPTDLQAQFMGLMTQAEGTSVITESVFENRFMHVQELIRLGADITSKSRVAIVRGCKGGLVGAPVMATDLRASSCLVLAGLVAQGETLISRIYHLDRGYEKLERKLSGLGASIQRLV